MYLLRSVYYLFSARSEGARLVGVRENGVTIRTRVESPPRPAAFVCVHTPPSLATTPADNYLPDPIFPRP